MLTTQAVPRFATTRLATGPALHYAEQGDPGGEAILMIHGWPDSWFSFSRVLARLPRHLRVLVPDQRGFGDSEHPDGGYTIDDLAGDAAAFLDAVGVARATVVGHSLGSFVARRLAEVHPARVTRLVLIGSAPSASNEVTREARAGLPATDAPISAEFAHAFQASTALRPLPREFFERIVAESLKIPPRVWRDVLDSLLAFDDSAEVGRITAPTLLLWGVRDALFGREDRARLAVAMPRAQVKIYVDTGHCPNWEVPEQVAADLEAFVRETRASGQG